MANTEIRWIAMPELRPGFADGGQRSALDQAHIVEQPSAGVTRTIRNIGVAVEWATVDNAGTLGSWTSLAAAGTTTVTTAQKAVRAVAGKGRIAIEDT
jgi:hypothetical protein